ncbi:hypothetical protein KDK_80180 [Dictyobacter kobayashii]|uniref:Bacterial transcriptional activator domain-containing protein n=2 Tax=Dictyobacter kobayashii TaxID=2014872 RepID=A0A402AYQ6_9CHLR|nr:hypothetical protein KDK_80180 [Dictyobacter kobayashii]
MTQAPRVQSVLAYLMLHHEAPQLRSQLAFLLWPETSEAQAFSNLRKVLHQLRQFLPESDRLLVVDRQSVRWQPAAEIEWSLDVQEFEQALAQAEHASTSGDTRQALARAIQLYRGEFFVGRYEEWILQERDRLRQLYLEAAERLSTLLEEERDYEAALKLVQRLQRADPLREATYRQLMRLYALQGDRAAALRTYHTCATTLEHELGVEPGQTTRQMYESLLQMEAPASATSTRTSVPVARSGEAPLLGRKREWGQLQLAWSQALKGHRQLVIVSGEAGIGKTRLADEMLAWVSRQGMATARAACYATDGEMAYAPVATWLRSEYVQAELETLDELWLAELSRLLPDILTRYPDLRRPGLMREGWQRQQFFESLSHALIQPSEQARPLLLLIDDLQWCDQETLAWLHYVLRFNYVPPARFLLLATVRAEEVQAGHPLSTFLTGLRRDGLLTELPLGPLEQAEIASLAEHVSGQQLSHAQLDELLQETEGNPLFVVETVRAGLLGATVDTIDPAAVEQRALPVLSQKASSLPQKVQAILGMRLDQLSPEARELSSLAAVIGRKFDFSILAQASSLDEDAVVTSLDELWQRRIVREQEDESYDFSHEKLRQQAYHSLSAIRRRQLHRRVAEAFVAIYADDLDSVSQHVATHYERAGQAALAIPYYVRAGDVAANMYANEDAVAIYQQAIDLSEKVSIKSAVQHPAWEALAQLLEKQGTLHGALGRPAEAREAYQRALRVVPEHELLKRARLRRRIAGTWSHLPQRQQLLSEFDAAERLLEQDPDHSSLEWQREWISFQLDKLLPLQIHPLSGDEMAALIARMRPIVERAGAQEQRAQFGLSAASTQLVRDRYQSSPATLALFRQAIQAVEQPELYRLLGFARFGFGTSLLYAGQPDEAEQQLQLAMQAAKKVGNLQLHERCRMFLAYVYRQREQVEELRELVRDAQDVTGIAFMRIKTAHQAWLAWRDGDLAQAEAYGRQALEQWLQIQPVNPFQWAALGPLLGVYLRQERLAEAIDCVRAMLAPTQQPPPAALQQRFGAVLLAWEAQQPEQARAHLEQSLPLARRQGYL